MRIFLALDTSCLNLDLKKLKVSLNKGKNLEHKWVPEEQWHIPILQLGEMGQMSFHSLSSAVKEVVENFQSFDLKLEGVWAYPRQDHARVFWIGVQNSKDLRGLQSELSEALKVDPQDEDERPFKPHLPIVRLRNYKEVSDLISPFKNASFGKVTINKILAYEMTSGGAFPTYRKIAEYRLSETTDGASELIAHP